MDSLTLHRQLVVCCLSPFGTYLNLFMSLIAGDPFLDEDAFSRFDIFVKNDLRDFTTLFLRIPIL